MVEAQSAPDARSRPPRNLGNRQGVWYSRDQCVIVGAAMLLALSLPNMVGGNSATQCFPYEYHWRYFDDCPSDLADVPTQYNIALPIPRCAQRFVDLHDAFTQMVADDYFVERGDRQNFTSRTAPVELDQTGSNLRRDFVRRLYVDGNLGCMRDCNGQCFDDDDCAPAKSLNSTTAGGCLSAYADGVCNDGFNSYPPSYPDRPPLRQLSFNCAEWSFDGGDCASTPQSVPSPREHCNVDLSADVYDGASSVDFPQCHSRRGFCFEDCRGRCFNLNSLVLPDDATTRALDLLADDICDMGQRGLDFDCLAYDFDFGSCPSLNSDGNATVGGEYERTIHLLALHPMSGDWDGGATAKPGVDLAVHLINSRKPGWDVRLPPGVKLNVHFRNSGCDIATGLGQYLDFHYEQDFPRIAGIIGCGCSSVCKATSMHATHRNIPQVSYGCTDPQLFESENHELFTSLMGSEMSQALAWIAICQKFGWTRVAAILDVDYELFRKPMKLFVDLADRHGISVTQKTFSSTACKDEIKYDGENDPSYVAHCFENCLTDIEEEEHMVIFYLMYEEAMRQMFMSVHRRHPYMLETPGRVWMGPGWYDSSPSQWNHTALLGGAAYSYAIREIYDPEDQKAGLGHERYWQEFTDLFPNWQTSDFTTMPSTTIPCAPEALGIEADNLTHSVFPQNLRRFNTTDLFAFDAVFALANAFGTILNETRGDMSKIYHGDDVMNSILISDFVGVSGRFAFNGRQRLLDYDLVNVQPVATAATATDPDVGDSCNQTQWEYRKVGRFTTRLLGDTASEVEVPPNFNGAWMDLVDLDVSSLRFHGGVELSEVVVDASVSVTIGRNRRALAQLDVATCESQYLYASQMNGFSMCDGSYNLDGQSESGVALQCHRVREWNNSMQSKWEPGNPNFNMWPIDYYRICPPGKHFDTYRRMCVACNDADTACMASLKIPCYRLDDRSTFCSDEGIFAKPEYWMDRKGYQQTVNTAYEQPTEGLHALGAFFENQVQDYLYKCGANMCTGWMNLTCTNVFPTSASGHLSSGVINAQTSPMGQLITETGYRECVCHHKGPLCSECELGYEKSMGSCQLCSKSSKQGFTIGIVVGVICLIAFALFILVYAGESKQGNGTLKILIFYVNVVSPLMKQIDKSLFSLVNIVTLEPEQTGEVENYQRPTDCYYGAFSAEKLFIAKIILFACAIAMVILAAVGQLYFIRKYSFETFSYYQLTILAIVPNIVDKTLTWWYSVYEWVVSRVARVYYSSSLYTSIIKPRVLKHAATLDYLGVYQEPSLVVIHDGKVRRFVKSKIAHILNVEDCDDEHVESIDGDKEQSSPSGIRRKLRRRSTHLREVLSRKYSSSGFDAAVVDDPAAAGIGLARKVHPIRSLDDIEQQKRGQQTGGGPSSGEYRVRYQRHARKTEGATNGADGRIHGHGGENCTGMADGKGWVNESADSTTTTYDEDAEPVPVVRTAFKTYNNVVNASEKIMSTSRKRSDPSIRRGNELHKDDRIAYFTVATILDGVPFLFHRLRTFVASLLSTGPNETERSFWSTMTIGHRDSWRDKKRVAATFSNMMANTYTYLFFQVVKLALQVMTCREVMVNGRREMRLVYATEVVCERTFFQNSKPGNDHRPVFILACAMLVVLLMFTCSIFSAIQSMIKAREAALEERRTKSDGPRIRHWMSMQQRYGSITLRYKPGYWYTNMYFVELMRDLVIAIVFTSLHAQQARIFAAAWVIAIFGLLHCLVWPYVETQDNILMGLAYFFLLIVCFCMEAESMSVVNAFSVAQLLFWVFIVIALSFIYFCSSFERFRGLMEIMNTYRGYSDRLRRRNYNIVMKVHPDLRCTVSWSIDFKRRIEQNMSVLQPKWGSPVNELFCFSHKVIERAALKRKGRHIEADAIAAQINSLGYLYHEFQLDILSTGDADVDARSDDGSLRPRVAFDAFGDSSGGQWRRIYPNEALSRQGVEYGCSSNCTFKKMFKGVRQGTYILRLRVFEIVPSDLGLGLLITEDDAKAVKPNMIQQTFFEFDLESFSSCEMSRRLPQIHFGDAFVDIESNSSGKLYDVVQMQIVNMEGLQQDTVVFREREESDPVELQSSTAPRSEDP